MLSQSHIQKYIQTFHLQNTGHTPSLLNGFPLNMYAPKGGGGDVKSAIEYNMQKGGGERVQIACKIVYLMEGSFTSNLYSFY